MSVVVKDLNKSFGSLHVLKGVNVEFKPNQITGFIGFNGSGKSTTFNIMANYIEDYTGAVTFDGKPWNAEVGQQISYLASGSEPKNRQKAVRHLQDIAFMYDLKRAEAMQRINDLAKKFDFEQYLNRRIGNLSAGNQQKIKLISALINPRLKYLFLDEPFDALDPIMTRKIEKVITQLKGLTIIITSHQMEIVQNMCDAFYILKDGVVVDYHQNENITITLAVNAEVDTDKVAKMDGVIDIIKKDEEKLIMLKDISLFKVVNKILIEDSKYVYSSIRAKNLAESFFEKYANETSVGAK